MSPNKCGSASSSADSSSSKAIEIQHSMCLCLPPPPGFLHTQQLLCGFTRMPRGRNRAFARSVHSLSAWSYILHMDALREEKYGKHISAVSMIPHMYVVDGAQEPLEKVVALTSAKPSTKISLHSSFEIAPSRSRGIVVDIVDAHIPLPIPKHDARSRPTFIRRNTPLVSFNRAGATSPKHPNSDATVSRRPRLPSSS